MIHEVERRKPQLQALRMTEAERLLCRKIGIEVRRPMQIRVERRSILSQCRSRKARSIVKTGSINKKSIYLTGSFTGSE
jgi:hypothetical protein